MTDAVLDPTLDRMRDLFQEDVGNRGLAKDPTRNPCNAFPCDFRDACGSLAATKQPVIAVVTGFFIPTAQPPAGETDGPLGALFLARAFAPLGWRVVLVTDDFCARALEVGLALAGLRDRVPLVVLPTPAEAANMAPGVYFRNVFDRKDIDKLTHLVAIERVGPSHTLGSLQRQLGPEGALGETYLDFLDAVPPEHQDRYHTMRGIDITQQMSPAHWLFEGAAADPSITTIGIGDGGNEIGMGKMPWDIIHRNIPGGGRVACRVPTKHLIVAGISNWGAYALAAGVRLCLGKVDPALFDVDAERNLLEAMVKAGPLVDGVTGRPEASVDDIPFERYANVLTELGKMIA